MYTKTVARLCKDVINPEFMTLIQYEVDDGENIWKSSTIRTDTRVQIFLDHLKSNTHELVVIDNRKDCNHTAMYMNPKTGSVSRYDSWFYENDNGESVNAVDMGEVIEVELHNGKWCEA